MTQDETKSTAGPPPGTRESPPAPGYARLSLIRFRAWQILLVLLVLIVVSFLLFPRERMLIDFNLERGRLQDAQDEIARMLAKDPDNPELLRLGAETHFLAGDMNEAIRLQERAVQAGPQRSADWNRLASFYEWNRNPRAALTAYERTAFEEPYDPQILQKVMEYARYFQQPRLEARAVVRLLDMEEKPEAAEDPLLDELTRTLNTLAGKRSSDTPDPLLDELLVELYRVRSSAMEEQRPGGIPAATEIETAKAALESFLVTGHLEEGRALARRLDQRLQQGITLQLAWVDYLRWNGLLEQALTLVLEIQEQQPGDTALARLAGELAGQTGNTPRLIQSLEQRLDMEPDSDSLRVSLAGLYRAAGDPVRAFRLYEELHRAGPQNPTYVEGLLATAEESDRPALKEKAADLAGSAGVQDRTLLERRANLYLAAENPRKAWPLVEELASRSKGDKAAVARMIQVAGYTNDPAVLKKALSRALALRPADRALKKEASDAFLWTDGPEASYRIQRDMAGRKDATRDDVFRLIELAGYTGRPEYEAEALYLAAKRLRGPGSLGPATPSEPAPSSDTAFAAVRDYLKRHPEDRAFRDLLIRLYVDSGRPGRAAPLLADMSDREPGDLPKALNAGEAYLQADRLEQGLVYFERALSLDPENGALRRRLATYYGWLGKRDKQIAELMRLEEDGLLENGERVQLAAAFLDRQEAGRALDLLRHVKDQDPLPQEEGLILAAAYEMTGKREQAMAVYTTLARSHQDDPALLAELGDRALWLNRYSAALTFYEAALKRDPKNLRALKGSGQIYAWNNDPKTAMARFEAYNRLNPDDFEVRYQLGELYFADQRQGPALKEYQKAMSLMDRMRSGVNSQPPSPRNARTRQ